MILGPEVHYLCPNCNALISWLSFTSANTIGAKFYSDGKMEAPMFPNIPRLTKCYNCQTIFWLFKAKEVDYQEWVKDPNRVHPIYQSAKSLTLNELFEALEQKVYSSDKEEIYIRMRILWGYNDRVRKHESLFVESTDEHQWHENIGRLLGLIDMADENDRVLGAELNRYLGDFDRCQELLKGVVNLELEEVKKQIMKKCKEQNMGVFMMEGG